VIFDRDHPIADLDQRLATATHILSAVPPDENGDPVLDVHGTALAKATPHLQWIGYLSTTGVYGDRQGGWVDESSALTPTGTRGRPSAAESRSPLPSPSGRTRRSCGCLSSGARTRMTKLRRVWRSPPHQGARGRNGAKSKSAAPEKPFSRS